MNISFEAVRYIKVLSTGEITSQITRWSEAYQTPTNVTREIIKSSAPFQAYCDWVINTYSTDIQVPVYAESDIFCEKEPIGSEVHNYATEHIAEFKQWIETTHAAGYIIEAVEI